MRQEQPNVDITVISGKPEITAHKHAVHSIHRFDGWNILRAMLKTDLVLSGGGSLLQDVTSKRSLFYYLSILLLGKLLRKKVMLYAQGIGPIKSSFARKITRWVCEHVDLVTVRDDGSYEELKEMGLEPSAIIITADAVFALQAANKNLGLELLLASGVEADKPIIGFAIRHWHNEARFKKEFVQAALQLQKKLGAQIVFIPLQFPTDKVIAEDVVALMGTSKGVTVLDSGYTTEEYVSLIGSFDLLIGMRLHALVFAATTGVPFLAVSYDPKVDRFVQGMEGVSAGNIENITAEVIVQKSLELWQSKSDLQKEKIQKLRLEAQKNSARAIALAER